MHTRARVVMRAFLLLTTISATCAQATKSNPFVQGCLQEYFKDKPNTKGTAPFERRVCNSDDSTDAASSGLCRSDTPLNYTEISVVSASWDTSIFYSWVIQILLSELLDVPAKVETGDENCLLNFYGPDHSFCYPNEAYNYDGFEEGNRVGDCRKTDKSCANVIPEVWHGQLKKMDELVASGIADSVEGNGLVGKYTWIVPKFLVEKDKSFLTHLGIRGEENRKKLAETFKRPTTWGDYCENISKTKCVNDENATGGYPSEEDKGVYFKEGEYDGYFRATEKNNCSALPDGCTGHFVDYSCGYSINTPSQLYWMNISLESGGSLEPNNAYSNSEAIQIWQAGNATKEPVIMWFWKPDTMLTKFKGTHAEAFECRLPDVTSACAENQISNHDRCFGDFATRIGPPERACGFDANPLFKLMSASLKTDTYSEPEASRSPAYDFLKALQLENLHMDDMFTRWIKEGQEPREAVCHWVAENIEDLTKFIPQGYPRNVAENDHYGTYTMLALVLASAVAFITIFTMVMTFVFRKRRVFVFAKYDFLLLLLVGLLFVSVSSIMYTIVPSTALCILRQWFLTLGNTLGLVPLLIKVSTINRLMKMSQKMKRIKISPKKMLRNVAITVFFVVVYLAVWTGVDAPVKEENLVLDKEGDENTIEIQLECLSSSDAWSLVALGWDAVLLVATLSLAVQTRNIKAQFNESQSLAVMAYSRSMYMILRVVVNSLSDNFDPDTIDATISVLLSLDSLFAVIIYFAPKFMKLNEEESKSTRNSSVMTTFKSTRNSVSTTFGSSFSVNPGSAAETAPSTYARNVSFKNDIGNNVSGEEEKDDFDEEDRSE